MKRYAILLVFLLTSTFTFSAASAPKQTNHQVRIENMKFNPDKIDIHVGDTVEWTNSDERDHNVTAKDGSFSSDNLNSGESFKFTFKKAGKYPYGCTLHPRMKGTVTVAEQ